MRSVHDDHAPRFLPAFLRGPEGMLVIMAMAMAVSMHGWFALLNNFVIERADFTGREIGFLQSIREIPGFLSFCAIFLLPFIREQNLALLSLLALGVGTALTGFFPTEYALYATTFLMSMGFHYYETMNQSLTLQWSSKERAPHVFARQLRASSIGTLAIFVVIILTFNQDVFDRIAGWFGATTSIRTISLGFEPLYLIAGIFTIAVGVFCHFAYPRFSAPHVQTKTLFLRRRYWLYYALTFMGGARRQIFMVFAGFMMVEKFGYDATAITLLYLINLIANIYIAPYIGKFIARLGERTALVFEYIGLIGVFIGYALVEDHMTAAALYVIDHLFFAFSIAIKTYFHKIADPKDMASTAGVSFTINHIAAVGIPAAFGFIWLKDPGAVFFIGAGMALISLILALNVPRHPRPGNEVTVGRSPNAPSAAPAE
ncbi:MAG: MFS transporter [Alphaproteobacteria bacterium]|nr:MFS transporter [Alphaproteobacteria bacterium]